MEDRRVSVETRQVELVLVTGDRISGEFFLQLQGMHLTGPQRVGEVLNAEECFLPLRIADSVRLVNLDQIVAVYTASEGEFDPLLMLGEEHQIQVTPVVGEPIKVKIHVNLPSGRNRAKDFLNQPKRFLLFLYNDQVVYLARNKILQVED
jgi:hypothetical protein